MNFKQWMEGTAYRYVHRDGRGLMNNQSLDYDRLSDDEHEAVQSAYLGLQQPPSSLHGQRIVFAFTPEGEKRHGELIRLLSKASKTGVVRQELNLDDYDVAWENDDGQMGITPRR